MRQLKSGKTRGANPRDLYPGEIGALEKKRDALQAQIREAAKERAVNRINAHTTIEADRVIENQRPTNERIEAMAPRVEAVAAIIVDGKAPPRAKGQTAQERLAQIRQTKSSLTTEAEELRELLTDILTAVEKRLSRYAKKRLGPQWLRLQS